MDVEYMGRLTLSVLVFAPGIILLAFCTFVGFLMLIEKAGMFKALTQSNWTIARTNRPVAADAANPAPGPIVANLADSLRAEAEGETEERRKTASNT